MDTRPIHIVATTVEGTERALPLHRCTENACVLADPFVSLATNAPLDVTIQVCLCREPRHVLSRLVLDHAHVIVGGRRGRGHRTAEERLARDLAPEGHDVFFADLPCR